MDILVCWDSSFRTHGIYCHAMQVWRGPEGDSTQWEDIHRKLGNLPAKEPVWKPEKYVPEMDQAKDQAFMAQKGAEDLEDMEDAFDDQRFLEQYRQASLFIGGTQCLFCSRLQKLVFSSFEGFHPPGSDRWDAFMAPLCPWCPEQTVFFIKSTL